MIAIVVSETKIVIVFYTIMS